MSPAAMRASHKRQVIGWDRLLEDLAAANLSQRQIVKLTGISRAALYRFAHGSEPGHADGDALLSLWREATGAEAGAVPLPRMVAVRRGRHSHRVERGPDSGRREA